MATSIASALLKIPVRHDVAMTGEITLRGRVLPIGGLKEKLLAAHRAEIEVVLIPKENQKDLKEIPRRVLNALRIVLVEHMDEVLREALVLSDPDALFGDHSVRPAEYREGELRHPRRPRPRRRSRTHRRRPRRPPIGDIPGRKCPDWTGGWVAVMLGATLGG